MTSSEAWTTDRIQRRFDVSRETMERLEALHALLLHWNRRINLISRGSEAAAWTRHFADSVQLWPLRPASAELWLDLGSGAGFPGLVIAALARGARAPLRVELVESDSRKAAFLHVAAREIGAEIIVHEARVEALPPRQCDVLTARALAPLDRLLGFAEKHRRPDGICLFPKGASRHKEAEVARRTWRFECTEHPSLTDPEAAILEIGVLGRV